MSNKQTLPPAPAPALVHAHAPLAPPAPLALPTLVADDNIDTALAPAPAPTSAPEHEFSHDEQDYIESLSRLDECLEALTSNRNTLSEAGHDQQRVACLVEYVHNLTSYLEHVNNVLVLRHNLFGGNQ